MVNSGNILPNGRKKETVLTYRFSIWMGGLVFSKFFVDKKGYFLAISFKYSVYQKESIQNFELIL